MSKKTFFNKLMSTFVETTPDEVQSEETKTKEAPKRVASKTPTKTIDFSSESSSVPEGIITQPINTTAAPTAAFNQEFYNHFQTAIEENDLPGVDYFEFKKIYSALKNSMAEVPAIQAAFASMKATNPDITIEKLLETADFYISILDKENTEFASQLDSEVQKQVESRKTQIQELSDENDAKQAEINRLSEEISENNKTIGTLGQEVTEAQSNIDKTKANWEFTIELAKRNIETDKTNIQTHLGQ